MGKVAAVWQTSVRYRLGVEPFDVLFRNSMYLRRRICRFCL